MPLIDATLMGMFQMYDINVAKIDPVAILKFVLGSTLVKFLKLNKIKTFNLDLPQLWMLLSRAFYAYCEPLVGLTSYGICQIFYAITRRLIKLDSNAASALKGRIFKLFLTIHIVGWIAQFFGHGQYERRAPALASNLLYANFGPFYVVFEYLNKVFGYRQSDVEEYNKVVNADIAHYRLKNGYPMMPGFVIKKEEKATDLEHPQNDHNKGSLE